MEGPRAHPCCQNITGWAETVGDRVKHFLYYSFGTEIVQNFLYIQSGPEPYNKVCTFHLIDKNQVYKLCVALYLNWAFIWLIASTDQQESMFGGHNSLWWWGSRNNLLLICLKLLCLSSNNEKDRNIFWGKSDGRSNQNTLEKN